LKENDLTLASSKRDGGSYTPGWRSSSSSKSCRHLLKLSKKKKKIDEKGNRRG
jgi:hypothetical protein